MARRHWLTLRLAVLTVNLAAYGSYFAAPALGSTFSLSPSSPSVINFGLSGADILSPGPAGGPPVVAIPHFQLGLSAADDIDALSFGVFQGGEPFFSVDANSAGAAGSALAGEATAGQQAGDIYKDPFPVNLPGSNVLVTNQDALGLAPNVAAGTATAAALDDIDGLDMDPASVADTNGDGVPDIPVYFSLAAGSPTLAIIGATPADILVSNPFALPSVAVSAGTMGFNGLLDDVDALLYDPLPGGTLLVSLTSGSSAMVGLGGTGADVIAPTIFPSGFLGPNLINQTISTLGLAVNDELNAFSDMSSVVVPEPGAGAVGLLLVGLAGLCWGRNRRCRRCAWRLFDR